VVVSDFDDRHRHGFPGFAVAFRADHESVVIAQLRGPAPRAISQELVPVTKRVVGQKATGLPAMSDRFLRISTSSVHSFSSFLSAYSTRNVVTDLVTQ
jgi:hypothetical protein